MEQTTSDRAERQDAPHDVPAEVDVVIAGAGPAGATVAGLLKRYRPGTRVLVLERRHFPRHKIGEALILDVNRILSDLGVIEQVDAAGFYPKIGSTFVWGTDRTPRTFEWHDWEGAGYSMPYTWHVERPRYDALLADHAASLGADLRFGWTVEHPLLEGGSDPSPTTDARVVGVQVRDPSGARHTVRARFTIDAAGLSGPLSRRMAARKMDHELRNIAVWGYHRGIQWQPDLNGSHERSRTVIVSHDDGWFWVIPVTDDLVSVGFVTSLEAFRAHGADDPEAFYRAKCATLPEGPRLFPAGGLQLVDYRGDGARVHTVQEYSYGAERTHGPGWALVGDAAGFVDAILSVGTFLGQNHAQFLAYALRTVLDGGCDEALALSSYGTTVRENLESFRAIAHMLYAYNSQQSVWWEACSRQLKRSSLVPTDADPGSFLAFFSGVSARTAIYDEALGSFGGHFLERMGSELFGAEHLFSEEGIAQHVSRARAMLRGDPVLRTKLPFEVHAHALPDVGSGWLRPLARLEVLGDVGGPEGTAGRRLYLPTAFAELPRRFDGRRRLSEVVAEATAAAGVTGEREQEAMRREVLKVVYRLGTLGLLEPADDTAQAQPTSSAA